MLYLKLFTSVYYFVVCFYVFRIISKFCSVSSRYLDFCYFTDYSLLKLSIFIRRHLTKEFSFAPSYCSSLSTRSRSRSQIMLISQCCRCSLIMLYFTILYVISSFVLLWFSSYFTLMLRRIMIFGFLLAA